MERIAVDCTTSPNTSNMQKTKLEGTADKVSKDVEGNRRLIVNYLPQIYTNLELRNLFAPYGEIESVRIMKDSKTGYSYGYGFVNFVREDDATSARSTLNGFELQNKHLKVSLARAPSDEIKHTNLYITNLPRSTTESDLLQLFQPYGTIIQKKLLLDKYTNLPRGVAFVRYETREEASNAIQAMHELVPEGHIEPIRVRLADDHGKRRASYLAGFQAGMGISSARSSAHKDSLNRHTRRSRSPISSNDHDHNHHQNERNNCSSSGAGVASWSQPHEIRNRNTSHLRNYRNEKPYHR